MSQTFYEEYLEYEYILKKILLNPKVRGAEWALAPRSLKPAMQLVYLLENSNALLWLFSQTVINKVRKTKICSPTPGTVHNAELVIQ